MKEYGYIANWYCLSFTAALYRHMTYRPHQYLQGQDLIPGLSYMKSIGYVAKPFTFMYGLEYCGIEGLFEYQHFYDKRFLGLVNK